MTRIRTEWLETFLAAVETGSFTAAAQRVHRSQSAVSLQIAQLEQELGVRLLERGRRGLRPTPGGERLLPYVRQAADAVQAVTHALVDGAPSPLRLGLPEEYADGPLPEVIARFSRAHPEVQLEIACGASCALASRLNDGALDLALVLQEEINNVGEIVIRDPTLWAASAKVGSGVREVPLPVAVFDTECSWRRWALDTLEREGVDYRIVFSSSSVGALRAAIRSGVAVGLLGASTLTDDLRPFEPLASAVDMPPSTLVMLKGRGIANDSASTLKGLIAQALALALR